MERLVTKEIADWYNANDERILLLTGGYGVGKTWVVRSFCREYDENYIYISMRNVGDAVSISHMSADATFLVIDDIYDDKALARAYRMIIKLRGDDGLSDYRIIMISSMVRYKDSEIHMIDEEYVRLVRMFPLSYKEFVSAVMDQRDQQGAVKLDDIDMLKLYLVTGGMPECVSLLLQEEDLGSVRRKQREIVNRICSKLAEKTRAIYTKEEALLEAMTRQNMKEEAGFSLRQVRKNARAREYGAALHRLEQCGLVYRVTRYGVDGDNIDIQGSRTRDYKLYITDVGLAGAVASIDERSILDEDKLFTEGNGMLYRSYILQEYLAMDMDARMELCYWHKPRAKARLPLIFRRKVDENLVLLNLKISKGHSMSKSIRSFLQEYPQVKVVDLSPRDSHRLQASIIY